MTATGTIHYGSVMYASGPIAHHKRWYQGVYITWCSATDGPCQGHAKPKPAEVVEPICKRAHTGAWTRDKNGWRVCTICRDELQRIRSERKREARERFNGSLKRRAA